MSNIIKGAVIAKPVRRLVVAISFLGWGFPRQCDHWLGMTGFLNLIILASAGGRKATYILRSLCRTGQCLGYMYRT